jgi:hypothetical protein
LLQNASHREHIAPCRRRKCPDAASISCVPAASSIPISPAIGLA